MAGRFRISRHFAWAYSADAGSLGRSDRAGRGARGGGGARAAGHRLVSDTPRAVSVGHGQPSRRHRGRRAAAGRRRAGARPQRSRGRAASSRSAEADQRLAGTDADELVGGRLPGAAACGAAHTGTRRIHACRLARSHCARAGRRSGGGATSRAADAPPPCAARDSGSRLGGSSAESVGGSTRQRGSRDR